MSTSFSFACFKDELHIPLCYILLVWKYLDTDHHIVRLDCACRYRWFRFWVFVSHDCHHVRCALCGSWSALSGRLLRRCVCTVCVCVCERWRCGGGWAAALAEPWANGRMFTLRRGTGLIITAGPGHIKGLRKGQTFCWSATVSRPASTHANTYTKGRPHTHLSTL